MSEGAEERGEVLRSGSSGMQCEVVLVRRRGVVRDILGGGLFSWVEELRDAVGIVVCVSGCEEVLVGIAVVVSVVVAFV